MTPSRPRLIFDVGAHQGEDTEFYLGKGFDVVAVEANPTLAAALEEKFHDAVAQGRLTVVKCAIARTAGEVEFFVNENVSVWGTADPGWAERNRLMGAPSRRIMVPSIEFGTLLQTYGVPHYVKIDIEGADMLCVTALSTCEEKPAYVSIESTKTSWKALIVEFDEFERLGYARFKIVNQARITSQVEPPQTTEGRYWGKPPKYGSTGLFGADLPGPWLTRSQALHQYARIFAQYRFFGDNTPGQRWVRDVPVLRRLVPDWYDTHAALA